MICNYAFFCVQILWAFFLLNTFKIKNNLLKTIHKNGNIHFKSIPLFLLFPPMWLHGLVTPKVITLLPSSTLLQHPNILDPLFLIYGTLWGDWSTEAPRSYFACPVWVEKLNHTGSVSPTQTRSRRHECIWGPTITPQFKRRHLRETRTNPGRKTVPLGVHSEVESKQSHEEEGTTF